MISNLHLIVILWVACGLCTVIWGYDRSASVKSDEVSDHLVVFGEYSEEFEPTVSQELKDYEFQQSFNQTLSYEHMEDEPLLWRRLQVIAHWRIFPWQECSVRCGGGIQIREVVCWANLTNQETDEINCQNDKPSRLRVCNLHPCPSKDKLDFSCDPNSWRPGGPHRCEPLYRNGGRLTVYIMEAMGLPNMDSKGAGLTDTYVVAKMGSTTRTTSVVYDDLDPVWQETEEGYEMFFGLRESGESITFEVYDKDSGTENYDDFIGRIETTVIACSWASDDFFGPCIERVWLPLRPGVTCYGPPYNNATIIDPTAPCLRVMQIVQPHNVSIAQQPADWNITYSMAYPYEDPPTEETPATGLIATQARDDTRPLILLDADYPPFAPAAGGMIILFNRDEMRFDPATVTATFDLNYKSIVYMFQYIKDLDTVTKMPDFLDLTAAEMYRRTGWNFTTVTARTMASAAVGGPAEYVSWSKEFPSFQSFTVRGLLDGFTPGANGDYPQPLSNPTFFVVKMIPDLTPDIIIPPKNFTLRPVANSIAPFLLPQLLLLCLIIPWAAQFGFRFDLIVPYLASRILPEYRKPLNKQPPFASRFLKSLLDDDDESEKQPSPDPEEAEEVGVIQDNGGATAAVSAPVNKKTRRVSAFGNSPVAGSNEVVTGSPEILLEESSDGSHATVDANGAYLLPRDEVHIVSSCLLDHPDTVRAQNALRRVLKNELDTLYLTRASIFEEGMGDPKRYKKISKFLYGKKPVPYKAPGIIPVLGGFSGSKSLTMYLRNLYWLKSLVYVLFTLPLMINIAHGIMLLRAAEPYIIGYAVLFIGTGIYALIPGIGQWIYAGYRPTYMTRYSILIFFICFLLFLTCTSFFEVERRFLDIRTVTTTTSFVTFVPMVLIAFLNTEELRTAYRAIARLSKLIETDDAINTANAAREAEAKTAAKLRGMHDDEHSAAAAVTQIIGAKQKAVAGASAMSVDIPSTLCLPPESESVIGNVLSASGLAVIESSMRKRQRAELIRQKQQQISQHLREQGVIKDYGENSEDRKLYQPHYHGTEVDYHLKANILGQLMDSSVSASSGEGQDSNQHSSSADKEGGQTIHSSARHQQHGAATILAIQSRAQAGNDADQDGEPTAPTETKDSLPAPGSNILDELYETNGAAKDGELDGDKQKKSALQSDALAETLRDFRYILGVSDHADVALRIATVLSAPWLQRPKDSDPIDYQPFNADSLSNTLGRLIGTRIFSFLSGPPLKEMQFADGLHTYFSQHPEKIRRIIRTCFALNVFVLIVHAIVTASLFSDQPYNGLSYSFAMFFFDLAIYKLISGYLVNRGPIYFTALLAATRIFITSFCYKQEWLAGISLAYASLCLPLAYEAAVYSVPLISSNVADIIAYLAQFDLAAEYANAVRRSNIAAKTWQDEWLQFWRMSIDRPYGIHKKSPEEIPEFMLKHGGQALALNQDLLLGNVGDSISTEQIRQMNQEKETNKQNLRQDDDSSLNVPKQESNAPNSNPTNAKTGSDKSTGHDKSKVRFNVTNDMRNMGEFDMNQAVEHPNPRKSYFATNTYHPSGVGSAGEIKKTQHVLSQDAAKYVHTVDSYGDTTKIQIDSTDPARVAFSVKGDPHLEPPKRTSQLHGKLTDGERMAIQQVLSKNVATGSFLSFTEAWTALRLLTVMFIILIIPVPLYHEHYASIERAKPVIESGLFDSEFNYEYPNVWFLWTENVRTWIVALVAIVVVWVPYFFWKAATAFDLRKKGFLPHYYDILLPIPANCRRPPKLKGQKYNLSPRLLWEMQYLRLPYHFFMSLLAEGFSIIMGVIVYVATDQMYPMIPISFTFILPMGALVFIVGRIFVANQFSFVVPGRRRKPLERTDFLVTNAKAGFPLSKPNNLEKWRRRLTSRGKQIVETLEFGPNKDEVSLFSRPVIRGEPDPEFYRLEAERMVQLQMQRQAIGASDTGKTKDPLHYLKEKERLDKKKREEKEKEAKGILHFFFILCCSCFRSQRLKTLKRALTLPIIRRWASWKLNLVDIQSLSFAEALISGDLAPEDHITMRYTLLLLILILVHGFIAVFGVVEDNWIANALWIVPTCVLFSIPQLLSFCSTLSLTADIWFPMFLALIISSFTLFTAFGSYPTHAEFEEGAIAASVYGLYWAGILGVASLTMWVRKGYKHNAFSAFGVLVFCAAMIGFTVTLFQYGDYFYTGLAAATIFPTIVVAVGGWHLWAYYKGFIPTLYRRIGHGIMILGAIIVVWAALDASGISGTFLIGIFFMLLVLHYGGRAVLRLAFIDKESPIVFGPLIFPIFSYDIRTTQPIDENQLGKDILSALACLFAWGVFYAAARVETYTGLALVCSAVATVFVFACYTSLHNTLTIGNIVRFLDVDSVKGARNGSISTFFSRRRLVPVTAMLDTTLGASVVDAFANTYEVSKSFADRKEKQKKDENTIANDEENFDEQFVQSTQAEVQRNLAYLDPATIDMTWSTQIKRHDFMHELSKFACYQWALQNAWPWQVPDELATEQFYMQLLGRLKVVHGQVLEHTEYIIEYVAEKYKRLPEWIRKHRTEYLIRKLTLEHVALAVQKLNITLTYFDPLTIATILSDLQLIVSPVDRATRAMLSDLGRKIEVRRAGEPIEYGVVAKPTEPVNLAKIPPPKLPSTDTESPKADAKHLSEDIATIKPRNTASFSANVDQVVGPAARAHVPSVPRRKVLSHNPNEVVAPIDEQALFVDQGYAEGLMPSAEEVHENHEYIKLSREAEKIKNQEYGYKTRRQRAMQSKLNPTSDPNPSDRDGSGSGSDSAGYRNEDPVDADDPGYTSAPEASSRRPKSGRTARSSSVSAIPRQKEPEEWEGMHEEREEDLPKTHQVREYTKANSFGLTNPSVKKMLHPRSKPLAATYSDEYASGQTLGAAKRVEFGNRTLQLVLPPSDLTDWVQFSKHFGKQGNYIRHRRFLPRRSAKAKKADESRPRYIETNVTTVGVDVLEKFAEEEARSRKEQIKMLSQHDIVLKRNPTETLFQRIKEHLRELYEYFLGTPLESLRLPVEPAWVTPACETIALASKLAPNTPSVAVKRTVTKRGLILHSTSSYAAMTDTGQLAGALTHPLYMPIPRPDRPWSLSTAFYDAFVVGNGPFAWVTGRGCLWRLSVRVKRWSQIMCCRKQNRPELAGIQDTEYYRNQLGKFHNVLSTTPSSPYLTAWMKRNLKFNTRISVDEIPLPPEQNPANFPPVPSAQSKEGVALTFDTGGGSILPQPHDPFVGRAAGKLEYVPPVAEDGQVLKSDGTLVRVRDRDIHSIVNPSANSMFGILSTGKTWFPMDTQAATDTSIYEDDPDPTLLSTKPYTTALSPANHMYLANEILSKYKSSSVEFYEENRAHMHFLLLLSAYGSSRKSMQKSRFKAFFPLAKKAMEKEGVYVPQGGGIGEEALPTAQWLSLCSARDRNVYVKADTAWAESMRMHKHIQLEAFRNVVVSKALKARDLQPSIERFLDTYDEQLASATEVLMARRKALRAALGVGVRPGYKNVSIFEAMESHASQSRRRLKSSRDLSVSVETLEASKRLERTLTTFTTPPDALLDIHFPRVVLDEVTVARVIVHSIEKQKLLCRPYANRYRLYQFIDPDFIPGPISVGPVYPQRIRKAINPSWRPAIGYNGNSQIFGNKTDPDDVEPGIAIRDGWLLTAICMMASLNNSTKSGIEPLIDDLFVTKRRSETGVVAVRLYLNKRPVAVVLDDLFPALEDGRYIRRREWELRTPNSKGAAIAHSSQFRETWPSILEKAVAKIYGSYGALNGGFVEHALEVLTGATSERYPIQVLSEGPLRYRLWEDLCIWSNVCHFIIGVEAFGNRRSTQIISGANSVTGSTDFEYPHVMQVETSIRDAVKRRKAANDEGDDGEDPLYWAISDIGALGRDENGKPAQLLPSGLAGGGVYLILDVRHVAGYKLIKLREPPSVTSHWQGDFSANSSCWTPRLIQELGWSEESQKNERYLWMTFDDFCLHFGTLYLCKKVNKHANAKWYEHKVAGAWIGPTAAGLLPMPKGNDSSQLAIIGDSRPTASQNIKRRGSLSSLANTLRMQLQDGKAAVPVPPTPKFLKEKPAKNLHDLPASVTGNMDLPANIHQNPQWTFQINSPTYVCFTLTQRLLVTSVTEKGHCVSTTPLGNGNSLLTPEELENTRLAHEDLPFLLHPVSLFVVTQSGAGNIRHDVLRHTQPASTGPLSTYSLRAQALATPSTRAHASKALSNPWNKHTRKSADDETTQASAVGFGSSSRSGDTRAAFSGKGKGARSSLSGVGDMASYALQPLRDFVDRHNEELPGTMPKSQGSPAFSDSPSIRLDSVTLSDASRQDQSFPYLLSSPLTAESMDKPGGKQAAMSPLNLRFSTTAILKQKAARLLRAANERLRERLVWGTVLSPNEHRLIQAQLGRETGSNLSLWDASATNPLIECEDDRVFALTSSNVVATSGKPVSKRTIELTAMLKPGKYTILAATAFPTQEGAFTLSIEATSPYKVRQIWPPRSPPHEQEAASVAETCWAVSTATYRDLQLNQWEVLRDRVIFGYNRAKDSLHKVFCSRRISCRRKGKVPDAASPLPTNNKTATPPIQNPAELEKLRVPPQKVVADDVTENGNDNRAPSHLTGSTPLSPQTVQDTETQTSEAANQMEAGSETDPMYSEGVSATSDTLAKLYYTPGLELAVDGDVTASPMGLDTSLQPQSANDYTVVTVQPNSSPYSDVVLPMPSPGQFSTASTYNAEKRHTMPTTNSGHAFGSPAGTDTTSRRFLDTSIVYPQDNAPPLQTPIDSVVQPLPSALYTPHTRILRNPGDKTLIVRYALAKLRECLLATDLKGSSQRLISQLRSNISHREALLSQEKRNAEREEQLSTQDATQSLPETLSMLYNKLYKHLVLKFGLGTFPEEVITHLDRLRAVEKQLAGEISRKYSLSAKKSLIFLQQTSVNLHHLYQVPQIRSDRTSLAPVARICRIAGTITDIEVGLLMRSYELPLFRLPSVLYRPLPLLDVDLDTFFVNMDTLTKPLPEDQGSMNIEALWVLAVPTYLYSLTPHQRLMLFGKEGEGVRSRLELIESVGTESRDRMGARVDSSGYLVASYEGHQMGRTWQLPEPLTLKELKNVDAGRGLLQNLVDDEETMDNMDQEIEALKKHSPGSKGSRPVRLRMTDEEARLEERARIYVDGLNSVLAADYVPPTHKRSTIQSTAYYDRAHDTSPSNALHTTPAALTSATTQGHREFVSIQVQPRSEGQDASNGADSHRPVLQQSPYEEVSNASTSANSNAVSAFK